MQLNLIGSFTLLGLLITTQTTAQESRTISAEVVEATVFFNGAELIHTASANLQRGSGEILIEGLSPAIDINSIKVKTSNNVVISAFEFSIDYLSSAKATTPQIKKITDSITLQQAALDKVNIDLTINQQIVNYLNAGVSKNVSGSEAGMPVDELVKTMDYYKTKSTEVYALLANLQKTKNELESSLQRLRNQYNQESVKGSKTSGVLKLSFSAPMAGNTNFMITYFTQSASWIPFYDINIISADLPIKIGAKAKVMQTTGLDWEKIRLTFSTATPSNGKSAPLFSYWILEDMSSYYRQMASNKMMTQNSYSYAVSDLMLEETIVTGYGGESQNLAEYSYQEPTPEPVYIINGQAASADVYSELDPNTIKDVTVLDGSQARLQYGSGARGGAVVVTLKSGMEDYVTTAENAMNVVYSIDMPYSVPGNGKVQTVDLITKETLAEYQYYCAPKLDPEVYLIAELPNWEQLGLLSGSANITYDGTYIGETFINASSTLEKLALTLGTDQRVSVKREKMADRSSTKFAGNDIVQVMSYKLTVKNNRTQSLKMVLKEQYPLSLQKDIVVTLIKENTTPWSFNIESLGVLTWEEVLAPGESKTYQVSYTVRYPKTMTLNL